MDYARPQAMPAGTRHQQRYNRDCQTTQFCASGIISVSLKTSTHSRLLNSPAGYNTRVTRSHAPA
jgi:hypothetical protein